MTLTPPDVPSPIDLRVAEDAATWAAEAMAKRPQRTQFFSVMASELRAVGALRVLELGSGPGFLARHLLEAAPELDLSLLDFSDAMHDLARNRLGPLAKKVGFIKGDFLDPDWCRALGTFDAVVTMQAVHELRHKRRAVALHTAVRSLLGDDGIYLVCDHYAGDDGMRNHELFMTADEQRAALSSAGFGDVHRSRMEAGLVLHRARVGSVP